MCLKDGLGQEMCSAHSYPQGDVGRELGTAASESVHEGLGSVLE